MGGCLNEEKKCRSVSVATSTVLLFLGEEGTAMGAPRGVSLCRDITNFAIGIISHTTHKTEEPPGNVSLAKGTHPLTISGAVPSKAALAHTGRPPHNKSPTHHSPFLREERAASCVRVFVYQAQTRRDGAALGLPAAFPSLEMAARGSVRNERPDL